MLLELRIRNFAIIDQVALEFGPGLNVLSGETGAGKTIIMNALGLLLGMRASPERWSAPITRRPWSKDCFRSRAKDWTPICSATLDEPAPQGTARQTRGLRSGPLARADQR